MNTTQEEAAALSAVPKRVELPRFGLYRHRLGQVEARAMAEPGITSTNELLDALEPDEQLAVVEFWHRENGEWEREPLYYEDLSFRYPAAFARAGQQWHIIGGTINGASRGELLACTNHRVVHRIVPGWGELDGLNRVKTMSRLMQPSVRGEPFRLRMLVVDDPVHDGDGILGASGLEKMRAAFQHPQATLFKCISHGIKVVLRRCHPHWDQLPEGVNWRDRELVFHDAPIDGVLFRDNLKLRKDDYPHGTVAEFTEADLRLHCTDTRSSYSRAGIGRQLLQYLPAELAAQILAASDIPLLASNWAKALTGDVAALKYLLGLTQDASADEHELRSQLLRHLEAGCQDVRIPYLRARVLPVLAGIFRNHIRKGAAPGAYLFSAPSTRLGRFEVAVPARMLSHEERDRIRRGERVKLLALRYPITGPQSINAVEVVGMHSGAVCYLNPTTWRDSFQGDHDGDAVTLLRVDPTGWKNSEPFIPPTSGKPPRISTPKALEQAAFSKRDVALGESALAEFVHHQWQSFGGYDPNEVNELGVRVVCAAVDRAKHGSVDWGIAPDRFRNDYLPEREGRSPQATLGSMEVRDCPSPETEIMARLHLLKEHEFGHNRSGWELLLGLVKDWTVQTPLLAQGDHEGLHHRILELHAALPAPDREVFGLVKLARGRWASVVDKWKKGGDDACLKAFSDRFQQWVQTAAQPLVRRVLLELGKQLLRKGKKGNASLFLSQVPVELLREVYATRA